MGGKFVHVITNLTDTDITIAGEGAVDVVAPAGGSLTIPQNATAGIIKSPSDADKFIVFGNTASA